MSKHKLSSGRLAASRFGLFVTMAIVGMATSPLKAVILEPSNAVASYYHLPRTNNMGLPETRASAFQVLTNGVVDHAGGIDRFDTWVADDVNTSPSHTVYDFVGLTYDTPQRFDTLTLELGIQFGDGGDFDSLPKVYILKNTTFLGDQVEPNISPNWVELPGAVETTGHVFSPLNTPGPGGTIRFDLSSLPTDDRIGWGWAIGGVDGNSNANGVNNFISVTETFAEGAPAPVPQKFYSSTLRPVNVVSNAYHTPGLGGEPFPDTRAHAFKSITNGIVDHVSFDEGFDTFQGDGAGTITDFVGLQYATLNVFDSVTVELGRQFGDGGDWDAAPKVYILKNPVDTNIASPELDPDNWLELTAPETTGHVFDPLGPAGGTPGGTVTFSLAGFTQDQRTGWGIAVGGVDGNANDAGIQNFISITEMSVVGSVIPGPYDLSLQVNTTTGEVKIMNNTNIDINLDYYEVTSEDGSLDVSASGWNSLQDPGLNAPAFPSGSGSGNGWEELGNLDETIAAEFYLQGSTEMDGGTSVSLGSLFAGGTQDLFFRYGIGEAYFDGVVEYITGPALLGDFNSDGSVDAADYLVWRNNVGSSDGVLSGNGAGTGTVDGDDYELWKDHYGEGAGALASGVNSVPEPGSVLLGGAMAMLGLLVGRRYR